MNATAKLIGNGIGFAEGMSGKQVDDMKDRLSRHCALQRTRVESFNACHVVSVKRRKPIRKEITCP